MKTLGIVFAISLIVAGLIGLTWIIRKAGIVEWLRGLGKGKAKK